MPYATYDLPATLDAEIADLESLIGRHLRGDCAEDVLKGSRVPFGVYEQRRKGAFMVRVRCPAGLITPAQLETVAALAAEYGSGSIHLTTRQEVQIHQVNLRDVIAVIRRLRHAGLATRGGGGNTVRNIVASPESGLFDGEAFDVTPYAVALTNRFLQEPDSWGLPRKYKIAFSCSEDDTGHAAFTDLGFIARRAGGVRGFRVYVAGGLGAKSQVGHLLHAFVPVEDVYPIAKAIKRLFDKQGNRQDRHAARLRYLWNQLGDGEFVARYEQELDGVRRSGAAPLALPAGPEQAPPEDEKARAFSALATSADFRRWKERFVREQRRRGRFAVLVPVEFGDLGHRQASALARVLAPLGHDVVRVAFGQNLLLRNLPAGRLEEIFRLSQEISDLSAKPLLFGASVACAGADTCKLGLCLSKGALRAAHARLVESALDLDGLGDFKLHLSGCPNNCGQHSIAHLGFSGKASHRGGRSYPAYKISVRGGGSSPSALAEEVGEISARDLPEMVVTFLSHYLSRKDRYGSYSDYLEAEGKQAIRDYAVRLRDIPPFEEDPRYYTDWGASGPFSLAERGAGECAAGPPR